MSGAPRFYELFGPADRDPAPPPAHGSVSRVRAGRYAGAALENEADIVRTARQGVRNETLNKSTFKLAGLVAAGHLDEDMVRGHLTDAARVAGLPDAEIARTIDSGMRAGSEHPRVVPERPEPGSFDARELVTGPPAEGGEGDGDAAHTFALEVAREAYRLRVRDAARDEVAAEKAAAADVPGPVRLDAFLGVPDEPVTHRIAGLWPTGGRVVLAAQNKAGKTTLVGNAVRCLVDGDRFLGGFDVEQARRVVLIDDELDERMLRRWLRDQGIHNADRVDVVCLRGRLSAFNVLDPSTRTRWAAALGSADVLVLDCLRPALDALGLSEDKDAGRFLEALDELTTEAGIGEALVVHHMGHNGERSRGDSRILDWPDALWSLVRDTDEDPTAPRRVYFRAYGRDVDQPEMLLGFDPAARRLSAAGGTRRDARAEDALADVRDLLEGEAPLSGSAVERRLEGTLHRRDAVRRALGLGVERGLVEERPRTGRGGGKEYLPARTSPTSPEVRRRGSKGTPPHPPVGGRGFGEVREHKHGEARGDVCAECGEPPTGRAGLGAGGRCARCERGGGRP